MRNKTLSLAIIYLIFSSIAYATNGDLGYINLNRTLAGSDADGQIYSFVSGGTWHSNYDQDDPDNRRYYCDEGETFAVIIYVKPNTGSAPYNVQLVNTGGYDSGLQSVSTNYASFLIPSDEIQGRYFVYVDSTGFLADFYVEYYQEPAPDPPSNFEAEAVAYDQIDLSWNDSPNETYYEIERSVEGGAWNFLKEASLNRESATDDDCQADTEYRYRIRSVAGGQYSSWVYSNYETTPGLEPPDMTASNVTVSDTSVDPEQIVTVGLRINNIGDQASATCSNTVYWSTDSTISTSDTPLGNANTSSISGKDHQDKSIDVTIPATATPGQTYYIGAYADTSGTSGETNTSNNASSAVSVSVNQPAFQVNSVDFKINDSYGPVDVDSGDSFSMAATVNGSGNGTVTYHYEYKECSASWPATAGGNLTTQMTDGTASIGPATDIPMGPGCWVYRIVTTSPNSATSNEVQVNVGPEINYTVNIFWWDDSSDNILGNGVGLNKPLRRAQVELYDDDGLIGDDFLGSGILDESGSYTFTNVQSDDADGGDLYVKLILDCPEVDFFDYGLADMFTETDQNVTSSKTSVIYLDENAQSSYAYVFNTVQDLYTKWANETGYQIPKVTVRIKPEWLSNNAGYEMEPVPFTDINRINLGYDSDHSIARCWNKFTIAHEYAHHIMYNSYGSTWPQGAQGQNHVPMSETDPAFALIEGWAEFTQNMCFDDWQSSINGTNIDLIKSEYGLGHSFTDIETNQWWQGTDYDQSASPTNPNGNSGEIVEGAVASIFWDIYDSDDSDEPLGGIVDGFSKIWQVILDDNPNNILEFYDGFISDNPSDASTLAVIYADNGIVVNTLPVSYDNFNDNSLGSLWDIDEENSSHAWIQEANQRLEYMCNSDVAYENARYISNNWGVLTSNDFRVKINFHYEPVTVNWGEVHIGIAPVFSHTDNHVSFAAGCDSEYSIFWYEKKVNGIFTDDGWTSRTVTDGTMYISYNASLDELYLSDTGYGSENAWQTISGLLQGEWGGQPVGFGIGGNSNQINISSGQAYLDNFSVDKGKVLNIYPDFDDDGDVDFIDFAEFAQEWNNDKCGLCNGAEFTGDDIIDIGDLVMFINHWLEGI